MRKMFKKLIGVSLIVCLVLAVQPSATSNGTANASSAVKKFKDVPTTYWGYAPIMEGVKKGYLTGDPNGTFRPNDPVTVAQFLKMLLLSMAEKNENGEVTWSDETMKLIPDWHKQQFQDESISFKEGTPWYINYVNTTKALDIIRDQYDGRFNENLTRERASDIIDHMDSFLYGAIQDKYADVAFSKLFRDSQKIDYYYRWQSAKVAIRGIMVGNAAGYFNPKANISRAEAAKIITVINNPKLRKPQKVDLSHTPYTLVTAAGYKDKAIHVFENWEMKKVYEILKAAQKDYPGTTSSIRGNLDFFGNKELQTKQFNNIFYFTENINDQNTYFDYGISFSGNVYDMTLSIVEGRFERASSVVDLFLNQIFKVNSKNVSELINKSVEAARIGNGVKIERVIENREVIINWDYGRDFFYIGISAYPDKK